MRLQSAFPIQADLETHGSFPPQTKCIRKSRSSKTMSAEISHARPMVAELAFYKKTAAAIRFIDLMVNEINLTEGDCE